MNRTSHLFVRLAMLVTAAVGLVIAATGNATAATCVVPWDANRIPCPAGPADGYAGSPAMPVQRVVDNSDQTLQWILFAAAVLAALAILAVVTDVLARRRWSQPQLDTAIAASGPDELPRAAGLLGDCFVQQDRSDAAEHAYRAAVDADDQHWSPIAQVALADLLRNRGERSEAQSLLEAAITSGHPRAVPAAQASLDQLRTGNAAAKTPLQGYETLEDAASASRRSPLVAGWAHGAGSTSH